jgi:hypothetical protein
MLDSGATHYVIGNLDLISGLQPTNHAPMLNVAGEFHPMRGKGKVFVQLPNYEIMCIDNVLYDPSIHRNLFLVGYIANQGYTLEFVKSTCFIRDMHSAYPTTVRYNNASRWKGPIPTYNQQCITH